MYLQTQLASLQIAAIGRVKLAAVRGFLIVFMAGLSLLLLCAVEAQASVSIPFGDFQGVWSAKTTYKAGAVVTYDNASYIALA